jgi:hypothetical protein
MSLNATLDGQPLACEEGSKVSSRFEEGDVSLDCRFTVAQSADSKSVFGIWLVWSHAQHTGFELLAD